MASKKPLVVDSEIEQLQAADSLNLGDYDIPNAIGANGTILQVDTGAAAWDTLGNLYLEDTDYYVATTGNDSDDGSVGDPWLTVTHAVNEISKIHYTNDATVTLHVDDGNYTENTVIINKAPAALVITGDTVMEFACTNVDAVAALGDLGWGFLQYDVRLTLNTTAGITTDHYVGIRGVTAVAGFWLNGCWEVRTVHDGTDITIRIGSSTVPAPMAVVATLKVPKTVITFTGSDHANSGFIIKADNTSLSQMTFLGDWDSGVDDEDFKIGVEILGSGFELGSEILISKFLIGVQIRGVIAWLQESCISQTFYAVITEGGQLEAEYMAASFSRYGFDSRTGRAIVWYCQIVSVNFACHSIYCGMIQAIECHLRSCIIALYTRYESAAINVACVFSNNGTDKSPIGEGNFNSYLKV